ncbi:MAG: competence/damage-inducible protein A [Anaerolineae bacterium]
MRSEIVTIGTELLLGEIVDSNAAYIAKQLASIGLDLFYVTTVGDNKERLVGVLRQALTRSDIVITTGGLGPTVDDVTREAVAESTQRELVLDEALLAQIEALFARWGVAMKENNRRQAYIPEGSTPVENPVGTAPGFIVEQDGRLVISLPGVPREMRYLMEKRVLPFLRERLGTGEVIKSRTLRTCGIGESTIDSLIADLMREANPTVGTAAHVGQVDVRLTAKARGEGQADALLDEMERRVRERLGVTIYGVGDQTIEEVLASMLRQRGLTIAVAETNTGGAIAQRLIGTPDGPSVLAMGMVLGQEENWLRALSLSPAVAEEGGSLVSAPVARAAAQAVREMGRADIGLAALATMAVEEGIYQGTTGSTWIALATPEGGRESRQGYGGMTAQARLWVANRTLDMVRKFILQELPAEG